MKSLTMFILLFLFSNLVRSTEIPLTQSECGNYDFSANFPPVRNQDGHGFCWAFAGSALLEEYRCKEDASLCRQKVSVLDESRCTWTMGRESKVDKKTGKEVGGEGNQISGGLWCGLNEGVCRENLAPYNKGGGCSVTIFFGGNASAAKCRHEEVMNIYEKWHARITPLAAQCHNSFDALAAGRNPVIQRFIDEFLSIVTSNQYIGSKADILQILVKSKDKSEFAKSILIPPGCVADRWKPKDRNDIGVQDDDMRGKARSEKLEKIRSIFKIQGRSTGVSICLDNGGIFGGTIGIDNADCKITHAIVFTGMRWNATEHQCEIQVRNSWGKNSEISGWIKAEKLMDALVGVTYIRDYRRKFQ